MKDQLLLTADSAVDRLDDKMAQMEILLSELDRRSNLLAQQSQRQQALHNQMEQQQRQLTEWFQQQRRLLEQETAAVRQLSDSRRMQPQQVLQVLPPQLVVSQPGYTQSQSNVPASVQPQTNLLPEEKFKPEPVSQRQQKSAGFAVTVNQAAPDKRMLMLEMAEQGWLLRTLLRSLAWAKARSCCF